MKETLQKEIQQQIQVYVRIRPLLKKEQNQEIIIKNENNKYIVIEQSCQTIKQEYDKVFDQSCTQKELFSNIDSCIQSSLNGYNSTILAYGQTGSGKTYTMFGGDWESEEISNSRIQITDLKNEQVGLLPRLIVNLFEILPKNYFIYASFQQIYNEKIYDLFEDNLLPIPLNIHESKIDGIYVEGLTEYAVSNSYDCLTLMRRGEKNRIVRQTTMNVKSSRSHIIFQLKIETNKIDKNGKLQKSKINLCDLAGSEKINKQDNLNNAHFFELKNINLSLTTLGKVIQNLASNKKQKYKLPIPYRESKITRLLQDSLGGNTITNIIVTIAPNIYNIDETISSLKFASRARCITTIVVPNKLNAQDQLLFNKLVKEIEYLKSILNMKRNGLNQNDIHFKMMKIQEENDRLRQYQLTNQEIEKLIEENHKMKEELHKLMNSDNNSNNTNNNNFPMIKNQSQDFLNEDFGMISSKNTTIFLSNRQIPKDHIRQQTEVQVRYKDGQNKLQIKKGYVEISNQQMERQQRFVREKRRVMERLQHLESLYQKNEISYSQINSPNKYNSFQDHYQNKNFSVKNNKFVPQYNEKYTLLQKQIFQKI